MDVTLTDEIKDFVRKKIETGQYTSEQAVIEAGLKRLRERDEQANKLRTLDDLIDDEFVEYCTREADDSVTLEDVLAATATIDDSMARVIIEEERADRL
jgi:putative addiction module CopG family antidote